MNKSEQNQESKQLKSSRKTTYGIIAGVTVMIALCICIVITTPVASPPLVKEGDRVKIQYTVWTSSSSKSPSMNKTIWVDVVERHNDSGEIKGLILGLYEELVGNTVGYDSDKVPLDSCEDRDLDGKDDHTGEEALSYGLPSDEFFGITIQFHVKILDVQKQDNE